MRKLSKDEKMAICKGFRPPNDIDIVHHSYLYGERSCTHSWYMVAFRFRGDPILYGMTWEKGHLSKDEDIFPDDDDNPMPVKVAMVPRHEYTAALCYVCPGDVTVPILDVSSINIVVHVCNDQCGWGAGVSGAIGKRWPVVKADFKRAGKQALGTFQAVHLKPFEFSVVNLIAQHGYKSKENPTPCDLSALRTSLRAAKESFAPPRTWHMPQIGSGLGGRSWKKEIEPLIRDVLDGDTVFVYIP